MSNLLAQESYQQNVARVQNCPDHNIELSFWSFGPFSSCLFLSALVIFFFFFVFLSSLSLLSLLSFFVSPSNIMHWLWYIGADSTVFDRNGANSIGAECTGADSTGADVTGVEGIGAENPE